VSVTDWPATARSRSPSKETIRVTVVSRPDGLITTRSPDCTDPPTIIPANPRKSWCGRLTHWTGIRNGPRCSRSSSISTVSRYSSGDGPPYQGIRALRDRLGADAYPKRALDYLNDWASPEKGWLRKFYRQGSDEPHFDLTPATEKAIVWLDALTERSFVGTESRLLTLFELLVRRGQERHEEKLPGLYPGQARRTTERPTGSRVLSAIALAEVTLTRVEVGDEQVVDVVETRVANGRHDAVRIASRADVTTATTVARSISGVDQQ